MKFLSVWLELHYVYILIFGVTEYQLSDLMWAQGKLHNIVACSFKEGAFKNIVKLCWEVKVNEGQARNAGSHYLYNPTIWVFDRFFFCYLRSCPKSLFQYEYAYAIDLTFLWLGLIKFLTFSISIIRMGIYEFDIRWFICIGIILRTKK